MEEKTILITPEEAMLIDWVLTMHTYDTQRQEQLETSFAGNLRKKIALCIVSDNEHLISFTPAEVGYLLIAIPITFRFYKEDIGFSLKKKLLTTLIPAQVIWDMEIKDDSSNEDSPSKGSSPDVTENSA